jgi:hypothetical protein
MRWDLTSKSVIAMEQIALNFFLHSLQESMQS